MGGGHVQTISGTSSTSRWSAACSLPADSIAVMCKCYSLPSRQVIKQQNIIYTAMKTEQKTLHFITSKKIQYGVVYVTLKKKTSGRNTRQIM
jgi:hypothetical protein